LQSNDCKEASNNSSGLRPSERPSSFAPPPQGLLGNLLVDNMDGQSLFMSSGSNRSPTRPRSSTSSVCTISQFSLPGSTGTVLRAKYPTRYTTHTPARRRSSSFPILIVNLLDSNVETEGLFFFVYEFRRIARCLLSFPHSFSSKSRGGSIALLFHGLFLIRARRIKDFLHSCWRHHCRELLGGQQDS
jgi:hypothetical protein